ncbi:ABC transporter ATP-binding protein [soil metagenome]|jgi:simple sugar transport system ATP-binding protein|nr:ABC transporter ATP-binding protein [Deinococcota bacterium]
MPRVATSLPELQRGVQPFLSVHDVTKRFPGVIANDRVNFSVRSGEVHALLGENGAGKTTLISMLYGLYPPDEGELRVQGRPVRMGSPGDAIKAGVGLVAQHFLLVRRHSVAENLALGLPGTPFFRPARGLKARILELGRRYGLAVDPDAQVGQLSPGEQQRVEILKALMRGAKLLILDEPTGVLTPQEAERLFEVLEAMKREGHAVVFITHKLDEVMAVADRVTVLRKGAVVGQMATAETTTAELARMMVGREVIFAPLRATREPGEVVLTAKDLHARGDRGMPALKGVSFSLRAGEMLGVAGVAGNGQRELIEVLTGLRRLERGTLTLGEQDMSRLDARGLFEAGVAHIPEERLGVGVVPGLSVADNLALRHYRYPPFSRGPILDGGAVRRFAERAIRDYEIATPSPRTPARLLSGGNVQKLILARELSGEPRLVVAAHPTYGLDVGASELTHRLLAAQRERGAGLLLVSEDLDEILRLCDRIMVLFAGESMGIVSAEAADRERLGLMMAGAARA